MRRELPGRGIAVLPAGSSEASRYPSATSWKLVLGAIEAEFPDACFCFIGKSPGLYYDACRRHVEVLLVAYRGDRSKIFSFDSIHERYI